MQMLSVPECPGARARVHMQDLMSAVESDLHSGSLASLHRSRKNPGSVHNALCMLRARACHGHIAEFRGVDLARPSALIGGLAPAAQVLGSPDG